MKSVSNLENLVGFRKVNTDFIFSIFLPLYKQVSQKLKSWADKMWAHQEKTLATQQHKPESLSSILGNPWKHEK